MKKALFISSIIFLFSIAAQAQDNFKIIYFKANLSCCQATACNNLQADIENVVKENFGKNVTFQVVKIADQNNEELVKTYSAKSQTVVIEKYRKNKLKECTDISKAAKQFGYDKNKTVFAQTLKTEIDKLK